MTVTEPEVSWEAPDAVAEEPSPSPETEPETYDEKYVERLRRENAAERAKAKERQDKLNRVTIAQGASKLANHEDLLLHNPDADIYDDAGDVDTTKLAEAVDELLEEKPYLAARKFGGDVGQGNRGKETKPEFEVTEWFRNWA
jgi:hypothetical protein